MRRRRLLETVGTVALGSVAGCLGDSDGGDGTGGSAGDGTDGDGSGPGGNGGSGTCSADTTDPDELPGSVRPDGDPPMRKEPLSCPRDDVVRLERGYDPDDLSWGQAAWGDAEFAIRVRTDDISLGDTVELQLTNVADVQGVTGNRHKYNIEVLTVDGWEELRVRPADSGPLGYTDEGIGHDPGAGFCWRIALTDSGLTAGHVHEDTLEVCPELPPGRYRFVFWEPTVTASFHVSE